MKNNENETNKEPLSTNYDLKSDAVEQLANADSEQAPEYSQEELYKYRSGKGIKIPMVAKVLFIKAWFAGAVCYFFLWGLSSYVGNLIDMLFVVSVALGIVTDLLVNNVIRFIEESKGENDRYLMFSKKGNASFFLNILYSIVIIVCVYMLYNVINYILITITGADTVPLGVEPILFGVFCMGVDMLFIGIKHMIGSIIADAKAAAKRG